MVCVSSTALYAESSALIDSTSTSSVVAQGSKSLKIWYHYALERGTFDHVTALTPFKPDTFNRLHSSLPPSSPFPSRRTSSRCRRRADRPPSQADVTNARPLNTCQPTSRTTNSPLQLKTLFETTYRRTRTLLHIGPFDPPLYGFLPFFGLEHPLPLLNSYFYLSHLTQDDTVHLYSRGVLVPLAWSAKGDHRTRAIDPFFPSLARVPSPP